MEYSNNSNNALDIFINDSDSEALDSSFITQEEYDELRKKIMERYNAPEDSTDTN